MGVDGDTLVDAVGVAENDVCRLAADAWEPYEGLDRAGHGPALRSTMPRAQPIRLLALERKKPVGRMICSISSADAAASAAGEGYRANSPGVTWLTRSSVHWAERMVATAARRGCGSSRAQVASGCVVFQDVEDPVRPIPRGRSGRAEAVLRRGPAFGSGAALG